MHCDPFLVVFPQRGYRIKPTSNQKSALIVFASRSFTPPFTISSGLRPTGAKKREKEKRENLRRNVKSKMKILGASMDPEDLTV